MSEAIAQVAIVGAGGQTGATILALLQETPGISAVGVCRGELTAGPLRGAGFDVRVGNIAVQREAQALVGDCDAIINLAAAGGLPAARRAEDEAVIKSVLRVVGPTLLVHFSSVAVYSTCVVLERQSFHRPRPDDMYGRDKLHLEQYLWRQARSQSMGVVVLRLGHVYGAAQWLSRALLAPPTREAGLPFDGVRPSNAIHVRNVAAGVRAVLASPPVMETRNLFDAPQSSWRGVADWNTGAVGLPRLPAMPVDQAVAGLRHFGHYASTPLPLLAAVETAQWMRRLPRSAIAEIPSLRALGMATLSKLRSGELERRFQHLERRGLALNAPAIGGARSMSHAYSSGAPGPVVDYTAARCVRDADAVRNWYYRYASPDGIRDWDRRPLTDEARQP